MALPGPKDDQVDARGAPAPRCRGHSGRTQDERGHNDLDRPSGPRRSGLQGAPGISHQRSPVRGGNAGKGVAATSRSGQVPHDQKPGKDVATSDEGPENQPLKFFLTVPFQSPAEADMARKVFLPDAQRQQDVIQKEFTVNGSLLVVWTTKDRVVFRTHVNSFLGQLPEVIRNIRSHRAQ